MEKLIPGNLLFYDEHERQRLVSDLLVKVMFVVEPFCFHVSRLKKGSARP